MDPQPAPCEAPPTNPQDAVDDADLAEVAASCAVPVEPVTPPCSPRRRRRADPDVVPLATLLELRSYLRASSQTMGLAVTVQSPMTATHLFCSTALWAHTATRARRAGRHRECQVSRVAAFLVLAAAAAVFGVVPLPPWPLDAVSNAVGLFNILAVLTCKLVCRVLPPRCHVAVVLLVAVAGCGLAVVPCLYALRQYGAPALFKAAEPEVALPTPVLGPRPARPRGSPRRGGGGRGRG